MTATQAKEAAVARPISTREQLIAKEYRDLLVVMQAAWIEWQHGGGAEQGMRWIQNTLSGPGLIPDATAPYGTEAQAWFDANRAEPYPKCFCGRPSNILSRDGGFCSETHLATFGLATSALEAAP